MFRQFSIQEGVQGRVNIRATYVIPTPTTTSLGVVQTGAFVCHSAAVVCCVCATAPRTASLLYHIDRAATQKDTLIPQK